MQRISQCLCSFGHSIYTHSKFFFVNMFFFNSNKFIQIKLSLYFFCYYFFPAVTNPLTVSFKTLIWIYNTPIIPTYDAIVIIRFCYPLSFFFWAWAFFCFQSWNQIVCNHFSWFSSISINENCSHISLFFSPVCISIIFLFLF